MRFVVAMSTPKVGTLFRALEDAGFSVDVVAGELPDLDPHERDIVFAPLPVEQPEAAEHARQLVVGDLFVDLDGRRAQRGPRPLELGRREFDLLACFARFPNRVISRSSLRTMVWRNAQVSTNTVEVHISALRRKLEDAADEWGERQPIQTVRGAGYVLRTTPPAPDPRRGALVDERQRLLRQREAAVARREAVLLARQVQEARRSADPTAAGGEPATGSPDRVGG